MDKRPPRICVFENEKTMAQNTRKQRIVYNLLTNRHLQTNRAQRQNCYYFLPCGWICNGSVVGA